MKKTTAFTVATIALLGGLAHRAQGQTYVYSASQSSIGATWAGSPSFETGTSPTGNSGGTTQDNDSWGGNANGTAGFGALGEAFVVTQTGVLTTAQLVMAGSAASFNVELYDLGPAPANWPSGSPQGSGAGNAPSITQVNALTTPVAAPSGMSLNGGPDLLLSGTGFTYGGVSSGQDIVTLNFQGGASTPLTLQAGELYMLSLDPTANADGTWWARGGTPVAGFNLGEGLNADGVDGMQVFEGKSSIRDFDLAVSEAVPEPCTMTLLGIGALAATAARRCSK